MQCSNKSGNEYETVISGDQMRICIQRLLLSISTTLLVSFIPLTQELTNNILWMGFPSKFYSINVYNNFSVHFGIGAFVVDVVLMYMVFSFLCFVRTKVVNLWRNKGGVRS